MPGFVHLWKLSLASALAVAMSGCAWTFMTPPPSPGEELTPGRAQCSGGGWAAVDLAFAALSFVGAAVAGSSDAPDAGASALANVAVGGLHVASGITGMGWASECAAIEAREVRVARMREAEVRRLRRAVSASTTARACGRDIDCKGDRICDAGRCRAP